MKKTILATTIFLASITALACTGFVAGRNATADGSMIFARDEDYSSGVNPKQFVVIKAATHKKGELFVNPDTGFKWNYPAKTLRYSLLPDTDPNYGVFGEAGTNEYGVAISSTVSAHANDGVLKVDPYTKGGLTEPDIASLVLMKAKTAREGVMILAEILDKVGAGEGNTLVIADKNEMWYLEIYTGHQYTAVKVPDDAYAIMPNAYYLGSYDFNSKDVISSKDIQALPEKNGLAKTKDGKFHLALTYREPQSQYDVVRIQLGQNQFNPSSPVAYDESHTYDLFRKPDKKIEVKDVMNFLRYRYEDTDKNADLDANNGIVRPIGDETNLESHIFQIRADKPSVMWLAMGNVEHSVFVPFYENLTQTPATYRLDNANYREDSLYWNIKLIHTLSRVDRVKYGKGVRDYWNKVEQGFIDNLAKDDAKIAKSHNKAAVANKLGEEKAVKVQKDADKMYRELIKFSGNEIDRNRRKKVQNKFEFKG